MTCDACGLQLHARAGTRFCSTACRMRAHRGHVVPLRMRRLDRWIRHAAKVPRTVAGRAASSTDPATWSTFDQALASSVGDGLGFVLAADGIACIDLDHCLDGGVLAGWAREILDACGPTYVEVSPSGTGLHVFGRGTVGKGDQRGRTIGFPTANVEVDPVTCLPADGVYAARVVLPDGSRHDAAVNLGRRPTFYEHSDSSLLEAHLIDASVNLYGEAARVQFTHFLRSERKFNGPDALIAQVKLDIDHARELASSLPPDVRP